MNKQLYCTSLLLLLTITIGCGGPSEKNYIPNAAAARKALETTLEKWKSGEPYGTVKGFTVPIEVFDARWQNKKKLETYEIVSEEKSDGPKIFVIKMKLNEDKEAKEVKYFVVGKDPLLIFREQDYNKASGTGS